MIKRIKCLIFTEIIHNPKVNNATIVPNPSTSIIKYYYVNQQYYYFFVSICNNIGTLTVRWNGK